MTRLFSAKYLRFLVLMALGLWLGGRWLNVTPLAAAQLPKAAYYAAPKAGADETAVFAGGCFWGIEAVFEHVKGVKSAVSGYSGGHVKTPTYEEVGSELTGHAEAVRIIYDPAQVSYGQLLRIFFSVAHDPTQLNRQGPDEGSQYRSAIFYTNAKQQKIAKGYVDQLTQAKVFSKPIVTQLNKLDVFYPAEDYHQDYMAKHPKQPYIVMHDAPKVTALKKEYPEHYR